MPGRHQVALVKRELEHQLRARGVPRRAAERMVAGLEHRERLARLTWWRRIRAGVRARTRRETDRRR